MSLGFTGDLRSMEKNRNLHQHSGHVSVRLVGPPLQKLLLMGLGPPSPDYLGSRGVGGILSAQIPLGTTGDMGSI